jgi:S-adenosylmethionine:tRNA ribosyltransferase-isomerase
MRADLFDFDLPADRIALRPIEPRDAARLLVVRPKSAQTFADRAILELPQLLAPGDILAVNDTKVIPARLSGVRMRGGSQAGIEVTLLNAEDESFWRALAKPAKRLKEGDVLSFIRGEPANAPALDAEVMEKGTDGQVLLKFSLAGVALRQAIERLGQMPLPPYIASRRPADEHDARDYQTVFAEKPGAVAAPTASLHFTPRLLAGLAAGGISIARVTLHVGGGTFLPVKAEDTADHKMHAERGEISQEAAGALNRARAAGGRIVAAGTTSLRILEAAAREDGSIAPFSGETALFITPGYNFKAVDILLTNFHLPRSTLFMLAAAFSGLEVMRAGYAHAIAQRYRFYSYGDACLLFPGEGRA